MTIFKSFLTKEIRRYLFLIPGIALVLSSLIATPVQARDDLEGKVIKLRGQNTLYMVTNGQRLVFPNEKIYRSWYSDFTDVVEISSDDASDLPLRGNVRYRPGVLMIKVQTVPKVYAVGQNGQLRWITSEDLARKLYGDNWNLLIDDVPDAFFANYIEGDSIDDESDFDPGEEEELVSSIAQNRLARIIERVEKKIDKTIDKICHQLEKRLNRLQQRLAHRGIQLDSIGQDFSDICLFDDGTTGDVENDDDDGDDDRDDNRQGRDRDGKKDKVRVCHIPPGNPANAKTIVVGKKAARAHLSHGDKIGRCDRPGDQEPDTTAPVISDKQATASATSTIVTWLTNEDSTSGVEYAKESLATASTTESVLDTTLVTTHELVLGDLTPDTEYFYIVKSEDASGNMATSTEMSFTTLAVVDTDTTPPEISSLAAVSSTTSATVSWTTNEAADSKVEYATESLSTATSTEMISEAAFVLNHELELVGLTASTTYFFIVESKDPSGNVATSTEQTFTTL